MELPDDSVRNTPQGSAMSSSFDPYQQWFGIPTGEQPPDHYRLLGVEPFCDDSERIAQAADQQMMRIGALLRGDHAREAQRILGQLASAKICLADPNTKTTYDAALRGRLAANARSTSKTASPPAKAESSAPPDTAARPHRRTDAGSWLPVIAVLLTMLIVAMASITLMLWTMKRREAQRRTAETAEHESPRPAASEPEPSNVMQAPDDPSVFGQDEIGQLHLLPTFAELSGQSIRLRSVQGQSVISGWTSTESVVQWRFDVHTPGVFRIELTYAAGDASQGGAYTLAIGEATSSGTVRSTGGLDTFVSEKIGFMAIRKPGRHTLTMRATRINGAELMRLQSIHLSPAGRGR